MAERLKRRPARALAALALGVAVVLAHLWVTREVVRIQARWSPDSHPMPPRIQVAFVRELAPAAPPEVAPVVVPQPAPRKRRPRPAPAPAPVASAPAEIVAAPATESQASAATDAATHEASGDLAEATAPAAAEPAASSAAATFQWPPSTRLNYVLSGYYRGDVQGTAQVQWVRVESRYQVHLDVVVGPGFAPLFSRRMSSDGELDEHGLSPRRYDEETKMAFHDPRRVTMWFEPDHIVMANGRQHPGVAGVQDTASQFVQLTWMFTLNPDLLQAGRTVELPLALPRRVDPWIYDVVGPEQLYTPIGPIDTVHLKPRREARPGDILSSELWFAPSLQYLPVRILIHQDAQTFIDLLLAALPVQGE